MPIEAASTWGRRIVLRAGLFDAAAGGPFAPFTQSPDANDWKSVVQVEMPVDSTGERTSRDCVVYLSALQNYVNNPGIVDAAGISISTPPANQLVANQALFGRVQTGRGGVTNTEEFVIPAHGLSLHMACDAVRVEVGFFPARAGWDVAAFQGAQATGWEIVGGVGTSGMYADRIRQHYPVDTAGTIDLRVPEYARRMRVDSLVPELYWLDWLNWRGDSIAEGPFNNAIAFADDAQPIPIGARSVQITKLAAASNATNFTPTHPLLIEWEREA